MGIPLTLYSLLFSSHVVAKTPGVFMAKCQCFRQPLGLFVLNMLEDVRLIVKLQAVVAVVVKVQNVLFGQKQKPNFG